MPPKKAVAKVPKVVQKAKSGDEKYFNESEIDMYAPCILDESLKICKTTLLVTYFLENETKDKPDIIEHWRGLSAGISKYILCKEKAPTTDRIHFHLLISHEKQFQINGIKRLEIPGFTKPNVRSVKSDTIGWCVRYCSKSDPSPLYEGYTPVKTKVSIGSNVNKFEEAIKPHFEGKKINGETVLAAAKALGISTCHLDRFGKAVSQLYKSNDIPYVSQKPNEYDLPIFKALDVWIKHCLNSDSERKFPLIIRTAFPESLYELVSSIGPHILHDKNLDFSLFEQGVCTNDAKFHVFNDVQIFNSIRDINGEHSSYIRNLFCGYGKFNYGRRECYNVLPVIYIENSNYKAKMWDNFSMNLGESLYVEIVNFDKIDYKEILNDHDKVAEVNQEYYEFDALYNCGPTNIDDSVVVRYCSVEYRKKYGIIIDSDTRVEEKPKKLNLHNYRVIDKYYGPDVVPFSRDSIEKCFSKGSPGMNRLEAEYKKRKWDKRWKTWDGLTYDDTWIFSVFIEEYYKGNYRNYVFFNKTQGIVREEGGWTYKADMSLWAFKSFNDCGRIIDRLFHENTDIEVLDQQGSIRSIGARELSEHLGIGIYNNDGRRWIEGLICSVSIQGWVDA
jgi:hypothetical protein